MDLEVRWSPEAIEDLEAIAEYIARDSEYYARTVCPSRVGFSIRFAAFLFFKSSRYSALVLFDSAENATLSACGDSMGPTKRAGRSPALESRQPLGPQSVATISRNAANTVAIPGHLCRQTLHFIFITPQEQAEEHAYLHRASVVLSDNPLLKRLLEYTVFHEGHSIRIEELLPALFYSRLHTGGVVIQNDN